MTVGQMDSRVGVIGIILAGGRARRMGGQDKALIELGGKQLLTHAITCLAPQVETMALSANGDPAPYAPFGLPIVADSIEDGGPLSGILAAMDWAREVHPGAKWIASVAVDTPFFPKDLILRLQQALGDGRAAVAASGGRLHPVFGLFHVELADNLRAYLDAGARKARFWSGIAGATRVEFLTDSLDPFMNMNSPEDVERISYLFPFAQ